jgi:hypothetical protein
MLAARFLYGVPWHVTSDCLVDGLAQWWETVRERFAPRTTLVVTLDNGPANHSRRIQCMPRLVAFVWHDRVTVRRASDPPSHSTYTPIERCWGMLEHHGNGTLLDSLDAVLAFARPMTWQGRHPVVHLVTATDETGVT